RKGRGICHEARPRTALQPRDWRSRERYIRQSKRGRPWRLRCSGASPLRTLSFPFPGVKASGRTGGNLLVGVAAAALDRAIDGLAQRRELRLTLLLARLGRRYAFARWR